MKEVGHERDVDSGTGRNRGSAGRFHLEWACWELRGYPKDSQEVSTNSQMLQVVMGLCQSCVSTALVLAPHPQGPLHLLHPE